GAAGRGAGDRGRRGHVVDADGGGVVGEAAVLVLDAHADRLAAGAAGQELAGDGGRRRRAARDFKNAVVVEVIAVREAGRGVGRGGVRLVGESHRPRAPLVDRPAVTDRGRGR